MQALDRRLQEGAEMLESLEDPATGFSFSPFLHAQVSEDLTE